MEKVDIAIGAVGLVAVIATIIGVVAYDELAGNQDVEFPESQSALASQGPSGVSGGTHTFLWDTPVNATLISGNLTVAFTGQNMGGAKTVGVTVTVISPNGTTMSETPRQLTIPAGNQAAPGTGGSETVPFLFRFADAPADMETTDYDNLDANLTHDGQMSVRVDLAIPTIPTQEQCPGGVPGVVPYPCTTLTFTAQVDADVLTFQHRIQVTDAEPTN